MATNFDFDLFNEALEEAPTAGFGPQVNFGKVNMSVKIVSWKNGQISERPFANGDTADKAKGEYLQIEFVSELGEFNPALTKEWKRRVDVKKSSGKGTKNETLTDWSETVEPSLIAALGKDWAKKLAKGIYLEFEEVDTVARDKQGNLKGWDAKEADENGIKKHYTNSTPRFVRAFKSAAECGAAREARYTKKESNDDIDTDDGEISSETINDVKGLIASLGEKQTLKYLETFPFGQYKPAELVEAAKA